MKHHRTYDHPLTFGSTQTTPDRSSPSTNAIPRNRQNCTLKLRDNRKGGSDLHLYYAPGAVLPTLARTQTRPRAASSRGPTFGQKLRGGSGAFRDNSGAFAARRRASVWGGWGERAAFKWLTLAPFPPRGFAPLMKSGLFCVWVCMWCLIAAAGFYGSLLVVSSLEGVRMMGENF